MPHPRGKSVTGTLRESIQESGESLQALSRRSGVGADVLSRFVRGERDLRGGTIDKLCRVLGLDLVRRKPTKRKALDH